MSHLIVTRFAVPRQETGRAMTFRDPEWLDRRMDLFRRFYVPSVSRCGVPAILLCGSEVAEEVTAQIADLEWARVEIQDDWYAGWSDEEGRTLTRLDSDDAIHPDWFRVVDDVPESAAIVATREHLRLDLDTWRLHHYRRSKPASLMAFRAGVNPYGRDHKELEARDGVQMIDGVYLLQVFHGGNISNRPLRPWRIDRRASRDVLSEFGLPVSSPAAPADSS